MTLTEEQRGMVAFDLEKARAADEALPYPLDANEIWVSGKGQMHINPPNAPSIFFTLSDLCEFRNLFHGQAAEIERLRASLIDLHAEYINTLEKNPDCSAWDLDEQSDADQRRLRRNAAHAISITEPPIYIQAEQLAARIKELEDALAEERAKYNLSWKDCAYRAPDTYCEKTHNYCTSEDCPLLDEQKTEARRQLQAEGKIGPDAETGNRDHVVGPDQMVPNGKVWQITEERKTMLSHCLEVVDYVATTKAYSDAIRDRDTIRAMLEENL